MAEKWTLAEGIEKLFSVDKNGDPEIEDLSTEKRQLTLDISFAEVEVDEIDGVKVEPTKGISVMLTGDNPSHDEDGDCWIFSRTIFPMEGETLPELVKRIAQGLGVKPEECIWEDGDLS